jgi:hypothetical protein
MCATWFNSSYEKYKKKSSLYLTGNTLRLNYKVQPVNAVWETVAVYRENRTEHTNRLPSNIQKFSPYLTGNTLRLRYKDQPLNAV